MTDREMLERAAKAADFPLWFMDNGASWVGSNEWNPLTDDGDALRLAVKLGIDVQHFQASGFVEAWKHPKQACSEDYLIDAAAATRRAIVRAAAALAKDTP
jgi:hypothetical protein